MYLSNMPDQEKHELSQKQLTLV